MSIKYNLEKKPCFSAGKGNSLSKKEKLSDV